VECDVNPLSALLYRLLDGRSQIHSDPELARACGFKRPIMHGRGTLGYACQLILKHLQDAPDRRLSTIRGYFQRPLLPGEKIRLEACWQAQDVLLFQVLNQEGETVISAGRCEFVPLLK
jgi:acyl dehydratase